MIFRKFFQFLACRILGFSLTNCQCSPKRMPCSLLASQSLTTLMESSRMQVMPSFSISPALSSYSFTKYTFWRLKPMAGAKKPSFSSSCRLRSTNLSLALEMMQTLWGPNFQMAMRTLMALSSTTKLSRASRCRITPPRSKAILVWLSIIYNKRIQLVIQIVIDWPILTYHQAYLHRKGHLTKQRQTYPIINIYSIMKKSLIVLPLLLASIYTFTLAPAPELTAVYTLFQLKYPEASLTASSTIFLRGDNCNLTWTKGVPLKKTAPDTWSTALLCPIDTRVSVKALLNDTRWMMGANHVFTLSAQQPAPRVAIYPSFNPRTNPIVETTPLRSKSLNNTRRLSVYYPPSYFDNPYKQYPLLVMHDGQNLFDPAKAAFGTAWLVQDTANQLIAEGKIEQIVIVGLWNTNDRMNEYTYSYDKQYKTGGKGDLYLDFIGSEVRAAVDADIAPGRINYVNGIAIGGSSLGGLISCYATYARPQIYTKSICMSGSFFWNNEDFISTVIPRGKYNPNTTIYIDSGDSGAGQDNKVSVDDTRQALLRAGYVNGANLYYYLDKGAQHNEYYWGKRFFMPLISLFGV